MKDRRPQGFANWEFPDSHLIQIQIHVKSSMEDAVDFPKMDFVRKKTVNQNALHQMLKVHLQFLMILMERV